MKELIKVNEKGLVSARELYLGLGMSRKEWSRWYSLNIEKNEFFKENVDWVGFVVTTNGNKSSDFAITVEFAKHIAMMSRTEKSHEYRNYFIALENERFTKHLDAKDKFELELKFLDFTMDKLNLNEGSKILMIGDFGKSHNMDMSYLPSYTNEKITKSLSELLKQFNVNMSSVKFNKLLLEKGIIKELERPSSKGGFKKFKSIINDYYGKNLINPKNPKESQPHYYEDKFKELVKLVTE